MSLRRIRALGARAASLPARMAALVAGCALAVALASVLASAPARAETLVTSLSTHQVAITSNYSGSQLVLFGAVRRDAQTVARQGPYGVAVVVRGPGQLVTVRLRERYGPVWINGEQQKFDEVPAYYSALSSAPIEALASRELQERLALGLDAKAANPGATVPRDGREEPFKDALMRLKMRAGLFTEDPRGVTFLEPGIFRAAIVLPAAAPPGTYSVETLLFADGALLARDVSHFELVKIGFEQRIEQLATRSSLAYGVGTALIAVFLGWLASVVFRRD